ncbi:MAG: YncE family protein [Bacilli bacterium]
MIKMVARGLRFGKYKPFLGVVTLLGGVVLASVFLFVDKILLELQNRHIATVRTLMLSQEPWQAAVSGDDAWITLPKVGFVEKVNLQSGKVLKKQTVALETLNVGWNGPLLVMTSRFAKKLFIYKDGRLVAAVPLTGKPSGLLLTRMGIFIANETTKQIDHYSLTGRLIDTTQAGIWPEDILQIPGFHKQPQIAVAEYGSHSVVIFPEKTLSHPLRAFAVPSEPAGIAISGSTLAVTDIASGQLTLINLFRNTESTIHVGPFPGPITIAHGDIWVEQVNPSRVDVYSLGGMLLAEQNIKGMISQFLPDPELTHGVIAVNALTHELLWLQLT